MPYRVEWDNGHASDWLPGTFDTEAEAEAAGDDWLAEMIGMDDDPAAAAEAYNYEVVEVDENGTPTEE